MNEKDKPKWDGKSRVSNDTYRERWEEIFGQKERDKKRYNGSVNFQEEGDFIFCTRCKDNTIHQPTFGKCMKCGLEEYNEKQ
jgi:ketosteroid isomerase-like protein|tara:strand:- start:107 stop:352 length:246 start_codon:yes stop_codon:yes gene_type:complete